jgi:exodeoxyribonuclease VII large subunit
VHGFGYPTVYERAGRFQFVVRELSARGEGLWRIAFERARIKLAAEGLLDPARKRSLPSFPACVGVVTSLEGAAIRDIVSVIRRRAPWTDILVYPARVQGDEAPGSIIAALKHAGGAARADVLIVGRGGGSLEDLHAFNDERVARAVASSPLPVVSAVGHEMDVTLTDLVADQRAPTPSAAAELAVPDVKQLRAELSSTGARLVTALRSRTVRDFQRLERFEERLSAAVSRGILDRRQAIEGLRRRLEALGPMAVLRRGYALALDGEGRILRTAAAFRPGDEFTLRLRDGRVRARTEAVAGKDRGRDPDPSAPAS